MLEALGIIALWQTGRFLTTEIAAIVKLTEAEVANLLAIYGAVEAAAALPDEFAPPLSGKPLAGARSSAPPLSGKPLAGPPNLTIVEGGKP